MGNPAATLQPVDRTICALHVRGKSQRQIADTLGWSVARVAKHLSYKLQKQYVQELAERQEREALGDGLDETRMAIKASSLEAAETQIKLMRDGDEKTQAHVARNVLDRADKYAEQQRPKVPTQPEGDQFILTINQQANLQAGLAAMDPSELPLSLRSQIASEPPSTAHPDASDDVSCTPEDVEDGPSEPACPPPTEETSDA